MTWVRVDDAAPLHPKFLEAGPEASWLWVCGMAHCNRNTTNGRIRKVFLPALYPSGAWSAAKVKALAERLVEVRLWHDEGDTYRVHQYEIQQEAALKENVEARREWERSRKAAKRAAQKSGTGPTNSDGCPGQSPADVPDSQVGQRPVSHDPVPSRPVEEERESKTEAGASAPQLELVAKAPPKPSPAAEVFEHWRAAMGKTQAAKMDGKRRARIEWALDTYGIDFAKRAIDGCARSDFHRGRDPKTNGKAFDDLTLIFRDAAHAESFAEAAGPARAAGPVRNIATSDTVDVDAIARRIAENNARVRSA